MIVDTEYQRRMASLARAEAGRFGVASIPPLAAIALARRIEARDRQRTGGAVDPVAASIPDAQPLLLRS